MESAWLSWPVYAPSCIATGDGHHCRPQQPISNDVACLHHGHDATRCPSLPGNFGNRLVKIRIEFPVGGVNRLNTIAFECAEQLSFGRLHSLDNSLDLGACAFASVGRARL